jgi:glycosyltransferase involved in cell wall biosynthesis
MVINREMKIGIVSTFPPLGSTHVHSGGVAGYTKKLTDELAKTAKVAIFCDKIHSNEPSYNDKGVRIIRCWKKGIFYPLYIWLYALKIKIDVFHLQHEYFLFGGILSALVFPFLILLLRTKAPVVITMHGIISRQFTDKLLEFKKKDKFHLIRFFVLKINLRLISILSNNIIVHENYLKRVLITEYDIKESKVLVIPHGVEINEPMDQNTAKTKLKITDKNVILFFGYLTKRKGLENLIEAFINNSETLHDSVLIIGAGMNPRTKNMPEYRQYYEDFSKKCKFLKNTFFVGFIEENDLKLYLSASDIVVFPYTTPIASSGPLHLAMSFNKIVLCSDIPTFKELLNKSEFIYNLENDNSLAIKLSKLTRLSTDEKIRLEDTIKGICMQRSWTVVSSKTLTAYNNVLKINQKT